MCTLADIHARANSYIHCWKHAHHKSHSHNPISWPLCISSSTHILYKAICILLLHPVLTSTEAGPDLGTLWPLNLASWPSHLTLTVLPLFQLVQTFHLHRWWSSPVATCAGGACFFIHPLAQRLHLHTWWYHPFQLALVVFFHPATGANTELALRQLALSGDGLWRWYLL